jgi:hypothetical protein
MRGKGVAWGCDHNANASQREEPGSCRKAIGGRGGTTDSEKAETAGTGPP